MDQASTPDADAIAARTWAHDALRHRQGTMLAAQSGLARAVPVTGLITSTVALALSCLQVAAGEAAWWRVVLFALITLFLARAGATARAQRRELLTAAGDPVVADPGALPARAAAWVEGKCPDPLATSNIAWIKAVRVASPGLGLTEASLLVRAARDARP